MFSRFVRCTILTSNVKFYPSCDEDHCCESLLKKHIISTAYLHSVCECLFIVLCLGHARPRRINKFRS